MNVKGNIEKQVRERAEQALRRISRGEERPIKHKASGFLCVKIGFRHRLLKRNLHWELMTHEKYNRFVNGKRKHS